MIHNMTTTEALNAQFELRIYTECIPRIGMVMNLLTREQIWYAPNDQSNSIGNLILHLCGNVTQWIGAGIGKQPDKRMRDLEFSTTEQISAERLMNKLLELRAVTDPSLAMVDDSNLLDPISVQGFEETALSVMIHVIEHFSYHTGQIAMIGKYLTGADLGFYKDLDLNVVDT